MSGYKLYYFDCRGWGQCIRYILLDNNVPYEEVTIPAVDDQDLIDRVTRDGITLEEFRNNRYNLLSNAWKELKNKMPFQHVPVLYGDNDLVIPETWAIASYLARQLDLYGKNDEEKMQIDVITERHRELRTSLFPGMFNLENENERRAQMVRDIAENHLPGLEDLLKKNKNGAGFFVGDSISLADYGVMDYMDTVVAIGPDALTTFPALHGFYDRMTSRPNIAVHRESQQFKSMPIIPGQYHIK